MQMSLQTRHYNSLSAATSHQLAKALCIKESIEINNMDWSSTKNTIILTFTGGTAENLSSYLAY